jgi:sec-independent protein translocase protein TatC
MSSNALPQDNPAKNPAEEMPLLGHLEELRDRLVRASAAVLIGTIIAAVFTPQILELLIAPYGQKLQVLGPTEGIAVYFRVAITAGLILAMPVLIYQFLMFVMPGLEAREKRYVYLGVPAAFVLFLIGVGFAWFIMLPSAIGFLSSWQTDVFVQEWQSQKYIPFITSLIFWIGLSFETPLLIYIMAKLDLVTPQFLIKQWRFAFVIIAIAAAMITPTVDPFNMALVMLPLIVLYGISILLAYLA